MRGRLRSKLTVDVPVSKNGDSDDIDCNLFTPSIPSPPAYSAQSALIPPPKPARPRGLSKTYSETDLINNALSIKTAATMPYPTSYPTQKPQKSPTLPSPKANQTRPFVQSVTGVFSMEGMMQTKESLQTPRGTAAFCENGPSQLIYSSRSDSFPDVFAEWDSTTVRAVINKPAVSNAVSDQSKSSLEVLKESGAHSTKYDCNEPREEQESDQTDESVTCRYFRGSSIVVRVGKQGQ